MADEIEVICEFCDVAVLTFSEILGTNVLSQCVYVSGNERGPSKRQPGVKSSVEGDLQLSRYFLV